MNKKEYSIIGLTAATLFILLTFGQLLSVIHLAPNLFSQISNSALPKLLIWESLLVLLSALLRITAYCLISLSILLRKPRSLGLTGAAMLVLTTLISIFSTFKVILPYLLWYNFSGLLQKYGFTLIGEFLSLLAAATVPIIFLAPQKAAKGLWCLPAVARLADILFSTAHNLVVWWGQPETLNALFSFSSIFSYLITLAAWVLLGLWVAHSSTESPVL